MNITHKMPILLSTIMLVMGLLYACPDADDSSGDSTPTTPTLKAGDITYNSIAQGTAGTATPTSSTITDFSTLKFALESISTHTGTQTPPTIAEEGGIITVATDTSAGSYRVTITPDGNTFTGNPLTVDFYVTVKPADIGALDTALQQAVTDYGLTGDLNYIDTSDVTTMSHLFRSGYTPGTGAEDSTRTYIANFNGDISKWDVSAVTDFSYMFDGAAEFSQDLSGWSVDSTATINMFSMFKGSGVASLPDWYIPISIKAEDITYNSIAQGTAGTATPTSTPTSTTITDFSALAFDLKSISTHTGTQTPPTIAEEGGSITTTATTSAGSYRVTITPDGNTFTGDPVTVDFYVTIKANDIDDLDTKFQQAITDYGLTGDFNYIDTSAVTDLSYFFAPGFNPSGDPVIDNPDRTYITNFNGDISKWDVSSVRNFQLAFHKAAEFNQDISGWVVSAGTDFSSMFQDAVKFNQDISGWDVSSGITFAGMFKRAVEFNQNISRWIVTEGTSFSGMFLGAAAFDQDLSEWKVKSTATISDMFKDSGMTNLPSWYQ